MTRNRVRKYRQKKKLINDYEEAVREEKKRERKRIQNDLSTEVNNSGASNNSNGNERTFDLQSGLQNWAIKHRITHMELKDLLSLLNTVGLSSEFGKLLPKDSRSVMKTPKLVEIKKLSSGDLWYHGVQNCLQNIFSNLNRDISITLNFNFDGLPLYNSSKICF